MASEWKEAELSSLIDIEHGFAFPGEHIHDTPTNNVLVTPGNFAVGGGFKSDKFKYFDGAVPEDYVLKAGDLVVTMTDLSKQADTLGYSALIPQLNGIRFLHNQRIGRVVIKDANAIDPSFLYYLLHTREYRNEILASATGTGVKHTAPSRILSYRATIPDKPEQQQIARRLTVIDVKIELNRKMNETLEAMARALFKSWFVDFDPVRAKAEGRDTGMPKSIGDFFPHSFGDSASGAIPTGWTVGGLDSIATFLNGLALQKYPANETESLPAIKIAQLRAGNTLNADRVSAAIPPDYVVRDGDVLFSWSGSLECILWSSGLGALNQHLFKVTSDRFPKWFSLRWIERHLPEFRHIAAAKATTMGHIQRHHLTEALVVIPPEPLMEAASKQFEPLLNAQINAMLESRSLGEIRDKLLPKLITGELRVPVKSDVTETLTFQ